MTGANSIEERVLEMMLGGSNDRRLEYLREQMQSASIVKRTYTGYGFFTELSVPEACAPVPGEPRFQLSGVSGSSPKLQLGIGFVLFVDRGRLRTLEAHTYDEPWPPEPEEISLAYTGLQG